MALSPFLTRPIPEPRRSPDDDPQRGRVYRMEREIVGWSINHNVPKKVLQEFADHVCKYYRVPPVPVIIVNQPEFRAFGWCEDKVYLNRGFHGANVSTLVHELAHYIVDEYWEHVETHGKEFVAVYMHLLDRYRMLPHDAGRVMVNRWKLRVARKYKPESLR